MVRHLYNATCTGMLMGGMGLSYSVGYYKLEKFTPSGLSIFKTEILPGRLMGFSPLSFLFRSQFHLLIPQKGLVI